MADPARKPQLDPRSAHQPGRQPEPSRSAAPVTDTPRPQLRPRAPRSADAAHPNEPRRLQERIAAAFTARENTPLEKTLMRLIIAAAACLVGLSVAGQGGVLSGLFR